MVVLRSNEDGLIDDGDIDFGKRRRLGLRSGAVLLRRWRLLRRAHFLFINRVLLIKEPEDKRIFFALRTAKDIPSKVRLWTLLKTSPQLYRNLQTVAPPASKTWSHLLLPLRRKSYTSLYSPHCGTQCPLKLSLPLPWNCVNSCELASELQSPLTPTHLLFHGPPLATLYINGTETLACPFCTLPSSPHLPSSSDSLHSSSATLLSGV